MNLHNKTGVADDHKPSICDWQRGNRVLPGHVYNALCVPDVDPLLDMDRHQLWFQGVVIIKVNAKAAID